LLFIIFSKLSRLMAGGKNDKFFCARRGIL
jgi:hypothetical protein